MAADSDQAEALAEQVRAAGADGRRLTIRGAGSKAFLGHAVEGDPLEAGAHRGVIHYEPTELMLTARAGTPLAEVEALLAENGQMLACEPPVLAGGATLGGAVAAGLSGPRRPFAGAVRDHVLGVRIVDGRGRVERFGGEVMKNVAGYDVSRLMVGALGTLGVLLDVSLKVLPRPEAERSVRLDLPAAELAARVESALRAGAPVTGAAHDGDHAWVRLGGAASAVDAGADRLGGDAAHKTDFWRRLRDQELAFFAPEDEALWRIALPPAAELPELAGTRLVDWAGQQIWLRSRASADEVRAAADAAGGHATLFRRGPGAGDAPVFTPLPAALWGLHKRLKAAFDPGGILNPGRMYPEL